MEIQIQCCKCGRNLRPKLVLMKDDRIVGYIDGYCKCGKITDAWAGVCELATVYGPEAVKNAADKLKEGV